jgi:hypothetical protein
MLLVLAFELVGDTIILGEIVPFEELYVCRANVENSNR